MEKPTPDEAAERPSVADLMSSFLVKELDKEIVAVDAGLAESERRLRTAEEGLAAVLEKQRGLLERRAEIRAGENFGAEFDALLKNPRVGTVSVETNPDRLVVVTTGLCVPFAGNKYFIDPLRVEVHFDEEKCRQHGGPQDFRPISVFKSHQKQKVAVHGYPGEGGQWPAPHVRGDGSMCLGNIEAAVVGAWRKQEWVTVMELLIEFLEACNTERQDQYFRILKEVAVRVE